MDIYNMRYIGDWLYDESIEVSMEDIYETYYALYHSPDEFDFTEELVKEVCNKRNINEQEYLEWLSANIVAIASEQLGQT